MTAQIIARGAPNGFEALTAFNKPVFESHAEIVALLAQRRGQRHAELFARPISQGGQIAWETSLAGPVRRWTSLSRDERASLDATRVALGEDLAGLVADLSRSGINSRLGNLAQLLHAALEVPGIEHLYVVGDRLVLAFWGFRSSSGQRFDPLARVPEPSVAALPVLPPRRSWWWLALLALLLLLLAALLAWYLYVFEAPAPAPVRPVTPEPVQPSPPPEAPAPEPPPEPPPAPPEPPPAPPEPEPPPPPPPPPQPDLPQERWDRGDIGVLKGCWLLGTDHPMIHSRPGRPDEEGVAHAGKLCFDAQGQGKFSVELTFPSGAYSCEAPLTATFSDGKLRTRQPRGRCSGTGGWWEQLDLSCTRNQDGTADCLTDGQPKAPPFHFRRDAGAVGDP